MKTSQRKSERHLLWLIGLLFVTFFALADTGIVVWCARLVSMSEILAYASAFALLSLGALVTLWQVER